MESIIRNTKQPERFEPKLLEQLLLLKNELYEYEKKLSTMFYFTVYEIHNPIMRLMVQLMKIDFFHYMYLLRETKYKMKKISMIIKEMKEKE